MADTTQLTSRGRYEAVCELRQPDRVPVNPFIMTFAARHAGVTYSRYCRDPEVMATAQISCLRRYGFDGVNCTSDSGREPGALGADVLWPDDDVPVPSPVIGCPGDLGRLRLPDPLGRNRMADQITALKILKQEVGEG